MKINIPQQASPAATHPLAAAASAVTATTANAWSTRFNDALEQASRGATAPTAGRLAATLSASLAARAAEQRPRDRVSADTWLAPGANAAAGTGAGGITSTPKASVWDRDSTAAMIEPATGPSLGRTPEQRAADRAQDKPRPATAGASEDTLREPGAQPGDPSPAPTPPARRAAANERQATDNTSADADAAPPADDAAPASTADPTRSSAGPLRKGPPQARAGRTTADAAPGAHGPRGPQGLAGEAAAAADAPEPGASQTPALAADKAGDAATPPDAAALAAQGTLAGAEPALPVGATGSPIDGAGAGSAKDSASAVAAAAAERAAPTASLGAAAGAGDTGTSVGSNAEGDAVGGIEGLGGAWTSADGPAPLAGRAATGDAPRASALGFDLAAAGAGAGELRGAGATGSATAPSSAAAAEAQHTVEPPLDSAGFAPALGARIALLARDGIEQARLNLNPAELGPIALRLALDGTQLRVDMTAELGSTRQVLEQSLPELASALREAGFTLAGGGVFQQGSQQSRDPAAEGSSRLAQAPRNGGGEPDAGPALPAAAALRPSRGLVDVFA